MRDGPARALDLIDSLAARDSVKEYHLLHAARGNCLAQLGRRNLARHAYAVALAHAKLDPVYEKPLAGNLGTSYTAAARP